MKVFMQKLLIVLAASILCACSATRPATDEQISSIGPAPTPEMVEKYAKKWAENTFKDSESARWRFNGTPFKFQVSRGWAQSGDGVVMLGWAVEFEVNAKNSYGGYTGYQCHVMLFGTNGRGRIDTCARTYNHPLFKQL